MGRRVRQLKLFQDRMPRHFGGMLLKGNAKVARPLSTKHPIHLVLKSDIARGKRSLLQRQNRARVEAIVRKQARAAGVRLYRFVNVGNHLHLVIKLERAARPAGQRAYRSFIRAVTGLIARHVLKAERNRAKGVKFWQARPFTRLVSWGRDFLSVIRYMARNSSQARARRNLVDWGFSVTDPARVAGLEAG